MHRKYQLYVDHHYFKLTTLRKGAHYNNHYIIESIAMIQIKLCFHLKLVENYFLSSKLNMKRSISYAVNVGKGYEMKSFTYSLTMPTLVAKKKGNSKPNPMSSSNGYNKQESLANGKVFRSAVSLSTSNIMINNFQIIFYCTNIT